MKQWKKVLAFLLTAAMTFTPAFSSIGAFTAAAYAEDGLADLTLRASVENSTMKVGEKQVISVTRDPSSASANMTYNSDKPSVVSIVDIEGEGKGVEAKGTGSATITVTSPADSQFKEATDTFVITVNKGEQVMSASPSSVGANVKTKATFSVSRLDDAALSCASSDTSIATVEKTGANTFEVTGVGKGDTTIEVTADETTKYEGKTISVPVSIGRGTQTITVTSDSVTKKVGDGSFNLGAELTQGDGTLTYSSSNDSVASVDSDGNVTIKKYDASNVTLTVTASQTTNYAAATKDVTLTVQKGDAAIDVASPVNMKVGEKAELLATITKGDAESVSYNYVGSIVQLVEEDGKEYAVAKNKGTANISVTTEATANYNAASKTIVVEVATGSQEIELDCDSSVTKNYGDGGFTITARRKYDDPGAPALTFKSSDESVATVGSTNGLVHFEKSSTTPVTITVTSAATANYEAATATVSLTITASDNHSQTITTNKIEDKTYGDKPFPLGAKAVSGADGSATGAELTYESKNTNVAKVDDAGLVTIVGVGTATINIMAPQVTVGDEPSAITYEATTKAVTITVKKADQTITVNTAGGGYDYSDGSFPLNATSNGDGTLTYKSSDESVATVNSSGTIKFVGVGTAKITINASSTDNYNAATAEATVKINAASQIITVESAITRTVVDDPFPLGATTNAADDGAKLVYTNSNPSVATIDESGIVTIKGVGSTVITTSSAATKNYKAATAAATTITVDNSTKKTQKITSKYDNDENKLEVTYEKDKEVTIPAASDGDGTLTYAIEYTDPTGCVSLVDATKGIIKVVKPGDAVVSVKASETANYRASDKYYIAVDVEKAPRTLILDPSYKQDGNIGHLTTTAGNTVQLKVEDSAGGKLHYESNNADATVNPTTGEVKIAKPLAKDTAAVITVTTLENDLYEPATAFIFLKIQKSPAEQKITAPEKMSVAYKASADLGATTNAADDGATLVYESDNEKVATVKNGKVTGVMPGTAKITITSAATNNYGAAEPVVVAVTVTKAEQKITGVASTYNKAYGQKFPLNAKTSGDGKITYKSDKPKIAKVGTNNGKVEMMSGTGTTKITITAAETATCKKATKTVTIKAKLATNPIVVKGKTANVSYTALQKKAQTVKNAKAYTIKNKKTKVTYAKSAGTASGFSVKSSNGDITVPKGKAKAKYKVNVLVKAAKNANYAAKNQKVTVTVQVK